MIEQSNVAYNFWLAVLETAILVLIVNVVIRIKINKKSLIEMFFAHRDTIIVIATLLIGASVTLFAINIYPLYWLWALAPITIAFSYTFNWFINHNKNANKLANKNFEYIRKLLTTVLAFTIAKINNIKNKILFNIKMKAVEELIRFDINNEFNAEVSNGIRDLGKPEYLYNLANKYGYNLSFLEFTLFPVDLNSAIKIELKQTTNPHVAIPYDVNEYASAYFGKQFAETNYNRG